MGMVMEYLGGTQTMVGCLDEQGHCTQSSACGQRSVWLEVELAMQAVLNSKSIADLVERDRLTESQAENGAELAVRP
jgi:DNA-binding IscR family transcriptional regulator